MFRDIEGMHHIQCCKEMHQCWERKKEEIMKDSRISSSLNGLESAISSGGTVNPVKENEKPKLALEARLRAAPLLTSSKSSFIWALLDFLMCVFLLLLPLRPGDATIIRLLDFLDRTPPLSAAAPATVSLDVGDLNAAATVSTIDWSDFVLANPDKFSFSIFNRFKILYKYEILHI